MLKRTELKKKGKNRSFISWIQFLTETELFVLLSFIIKILFSSISISIQVFIRFYRSQCPCLHLNRLLLLL